MLYTPEGIPIKTTVDNTTAAQVSHKVERLTLQEGASGIDIE